MAIGIARRQFISALGGAAGHIPAGQLATKVHVGRALGGLVHRPAYRPELAIGKFGLTTP